MATTKKNTTTAKGSLFAKAAKTATPKTTKAKEEKVRLTLSKEFFSKIEKYETLQNNLKRDKAEADMISDEIKEAGKVEWAKLYKKLGKNPDSVMLESKKGLDTAQAMFCPSDKYITITAERADTLMETYGEDIVETKTTFAFDAAMIEKYGEVISRLIEDSDEIAEADKEKIIKATTTYSIAKGSVDKLDTFAEETGFEIVEVFDEIKPIVSLKVAEVIKG